MNLAVKEEVRNPRQKFAPDSVGFDFAEESLVWDFVESLAKVNIDDVIPVATIQRANPGFARDQQIRDAGAVATKATLRGGNQIHAFKNRLEFRFDKPLESFAEDRGKTNGTIIGRVVA